jgi:hypothetical protein
MEIILYAPDSEGNFQKIRELIEGSVPAGKVRLYRTIERLSEKLHRPIAPETILIIAARNRDDLSKVATLPHVGGYLRTVVVAPDQEAETVALAFRLRPRFLTYANSNLQDLVAVLRKMAEGDQSLTAT